MEKKCGRCKQVKSVDNFGLDNKRPDKLTVQCKQCQQEYYKNNFQKIIDRVNQWRKTDTGKASRKIEREKYYSINKSIICERTKKRREEKPDAEQAHHAVNHAVASGKIPRVKTMKCVYCDNGAVDYHHHKGYDRENWLEVIPVCRSCHKKVD
jgi:hypothetical protein